MAKKKAPKVTLKRKPTPDMRIVAREMDSFEARMVYRQALQLTKLGVASNNRLFRLRRRNHTEEITKTLRSTVNAAKIQCNKILDIYTDQFLPARWIRSIPHLGIRTAAAFTVFINIDKCKNVSSLWRYAGLDPSIRQIQRPEATELIKRVQAEFPDAAPDDKVVIAWLGEVTGVGYESLLKRCYGRYETPTWGSIHRGLRKRIWNSDLRMACFRTSRMFLMWKNDPDFIYGQLFSRRREYETALNVEGHYADQAEKWMQRLGRNRTRDHEKNIRGWTYFSKGLLPPAHIVVRCLRWTVKILLAHYHQVAYYERFGILPKRPYILDVLGGGHEIMCPNWPFKTMKTDRSVVE